jgi:glycerol uptake facilitator-like aquaporin
VISPWGKRSGGHFNPAITFTFYRLGKVEFWDAWLYVIAQFLGAIDGVTLARYVWRGALGNHAVRYAVTVPGVYGSTVCVTRFSEQIDEIERWRRGTSPPTGRPFSEILLAVAAAFPCTN